MLLSKKMEVFTSWVGEVCVADDDVSIDPADGVRSENDGSSGVPPNKG